jgi:hypothetical protein
VTLPDSPHVGVDPHPDVRAGVLTRRTFRTFEHRPVAAAPEELIVERETTGSGASVSPTPEI